MSDKEALLTELAELLGTHLFDGTYAEAEPIPENGGLPLAIPYVRIEPWLFPDDIVELSGAWQLCVEMALQYENRAPVLAHQWHGEWCFRVPLYMLAEEYESKLAIDQWHAFEFSIDVSVHSFPLVLREYQERQAIRDGVVGMIDAALGGEEE